MSKEHPVALGRRLLLALALNLSFALTEALIGFFANSLLLLAGALHDAGDAVALFFSYLGWRLSLVPPNRRRTFGYRKVRILVAFLNALALAVFTIFVIRTAILRLVHPEPVQGGMVVLMAFFGMLVNGAAVFLLSRHRHSLNIRAALWHLLDDLLGSGAVLIGGAVVHLTGWTAIDPLLAIGVSGLVLFGVYRVFREAVGILIDATPRDLDFEEVRSFILNSTPGVKGVHDLHIWSLGDEERALSAHLVVNDGLLSGYHRLLTELEAGLRERFRIDHITFELECGECKSKDRVCID